jgi:DeoR/GlpR family transcriptional regulator of sugar metabolism
MSTPRHREIIGLLHARGECSVEDLAQSFGVSPMTIRRDLNALAESGQVIRTHGGAAPAEAVMFEFQFLRRAKLNASAKDRIGAAAASLVRDGQSVLLDSGTTTLCIARHLRERSGITVITTSLPIASVLQRAGGVQTLLLGGYVRREAPDLQGPLTESNLEALRADIAFIGADGIDANGSCYNASLTVARMLGKMIRAAQQVYVVADASKLGRTALASFGQLSDFSGLITDATEPMPVRDTRVHIITADAAKEIVHG